MTKQDFRIAGKSVKRADVIEKVTGRASIPATTICLAFCTARSSGPRSPMRAFCTSTCQRPWPIRASRQC